MKTFLMRILTVCCVISLSVSAAMAQETLTAAKRADILRLVQVTGSGAVGLQFGDAMVTAMVANMKALRPDFPPRASEIVREEVMVLLQQRLGGLLEALVPVYHENFTHEEIKGLLQFYETPLGKKMIRVLPTITQAGMAAGNAWGQSIAPVIEQRLRVRFAAEGIK